MAHGSMNSFQDVLKAQNRNGWNCENMINVYILKTPVTRTEQISIDSWCYSLHLKHGAEHCSPTNHK